MTVGRDRAHPIRGRHQRRRSPSALPAGGVDVPRLLPLRDMIKLLPPLHSVHTKKIITAIQRGTLNLRWRDLVDIYLLCRD